MRFRSHMALKLYVDTIGEKLNFYYNYTLYKMKVLKHSGKYFKIFQLNNPHRNQQNVS